jgi:pimeloyl-ACP methyl ester carboxylesterase
MTHSLKQAAAARPAPSPSLDSPPWPTRTQPVGLAGEPGSAPGLLPPAVSGHRLFIGEGPSRMAAYVAAPRSGGAGLGPAPVPLLLVHSVNAAASAAEVRPLFESAADRRPVMALELPGFGSSARHAQPYTPELMSNAVLAAAQAFRRLGFTGPVDLLAVSLSCEFAAHAALAEPAAFRSLSLVSPTGLESRRLERYDGGRSKDKPWLRALLERGPWSDSLFRMLTREPSMRRFLQRAWGSKHIDEALLAYNLLSVKEPGARQAPYAFIAGALFTRGAAQLYQGLTQPVWVAHGTRGEFARFDGLKSIKPSSAWTVDAFDAGAMPYFEMPSAFMGRQARFEQSLAPAAASGVDDLSGAQAWVGPSAPDGPRVTA